MALETEVGQKLITEDGINGLPVRLADISGAYDDGSPDGAVRSKIVLGDLVLLPLLPSTIYVENSGGAGTSQQTALLNNSDRTGFGILMSTPTDATRTGAGARVWIPFSGRAFGLRWQRYTTTPNFSVLIDGVAYGVVGNAPYEGYEGGVGITNDEAHAIIATDLAEGEHTAIVTLTASTTATKSLTLYGALVERRLGYQPPRPYLFGTLRGTVPIAAATIINTSGAAAGITNYRAIRSIIYANTNAVPVTITVYDGGGTAAANIVWSKSIAANDTLTLDFGDLVCPLFYNGYLTHVAGATGVSFTVLGGI